MSLTIESAQLDHLKPRAKHGGDDPRNLRPCCNICNSIKGERTLDESRGRLRLRVAGWPKFTDQQLQWLRARGFDMSDFDKAVLWFERNENMQIVSRAIFD